MRGRKPTCLRSSKCHEEDLEDVTVYARRSERKRTTSIAIRATQSRIGPHPKQLRFPGRSAYQSLSPTHSSRTCKFVFIRKLTYVLLSPTQRLADAKRQVYDFTIEVVTDMNRIAGAFGKGTSDAKALHQCWENLEDTRSASKTPLLRFMIMILQEDRK